MRGAVRGGRDERWPGTPSGECAVRTGLEGLESAGTGRARWSVQRAIRYLQVDVDIYRCMLASRCRWVLKGPNPYLDGRESTVRVGNPRFQSLLGVGVHPMQSVTALLTATVVLVLSCTPGSPAIDDAATRKFKILVVGEGVRPDTSSVRRIYPINRAEGYAMRQGVEWALQAPPIQQVRDLVEFVYEDDFGRVEDARRIAARYQMDPTLLAVIGHASSGTTLIASKLYSDANIPLLMPIATSPQVTSRTAFRLPLNDTVGQAPALKALVTDHLKLDRVYVVKDVGTDARFYTDSLEATFRRLLPSSMFRGHIDVSATETSFADVVRAARDNNATVIAFIGYGSTAIRLLEALNEAYDSNPTAAPVVLLTDGCINLELRPGILEVYLTAPLPDLRDNVPMLEPQKPDRAASAVTAEVPDSEVGERIPLPVVAQTVCHGEAAATLRAQLPNHALPNYHIYGYDAALILADAIARCRDAGVVSRACVLTTLTDTRELGACAEYVFRQGENVDGTYYAYRVITTGARLEFLPVVEFGARTLAEVKRAD